MIKSFLIILGLGGFLFAGQQLVLVVAQSYESTHAMLYCYEDERLAFAPIEVNLGQNGLGVGIGETTLLSTRDAIEKREGDKKAPIGVFRLVRLFGYDTNEGYSLPYLQVDKETICVDDADSPLYNKIIQIPSNPPKSYENMLREDHQYKLGIEVAHNAKGRKNKGSCIFIHVQKASQTASAGCTTMEYESLKKIAKWLDAAKNPLLIQIEKGSLKEVQELYPALKAHKED
jgi:hypothetical protein